MVLFCGAVLRLRVHSVAQASLKLQSSHLRLSSADITSVSYHIWNFIFYFFRLITFYLNQKFNCK